MSLSTLWDLSSASGRLPKMQILPQGCSKDGEGLQEVPSTEGQGHCHGLCLDRDIGCSGTALVSLHLTGILWSLEWAVWSWFMLYSWAPLGWDVLVVLESGRKVPFGNYFFILAHGSQDGSCSGTAEKLKSAERSPCAALLRVKEGGFRICVFSRYFPVWTLLDGMHPSSLLRRSFLSGWSCCYPTGFEYFIFFSPFFFKKDISGFPF